MSTIFDQMLARYGDLPEGKLWNAKYEVTQQIALAGLHRGGFFNKAAFYGGTCLRLIDARFGFPYMENKSQGSRLVRF